MSLQYNWGYLVYTHLYIQSGSAPGVGSAGHPFLAPHASWCLSRYWSCAVWLQGFWAGICAMDVPGDNLFAKGKFIAEALYVHCISPDRGERLKKGFCQPINNIKIQKWSGCFQLGSQSGWKENFFYQGCL